MREPWESGWLKVRLAKAGHTGGVGIDLTAMTGWFVSSPKPTHPTPMHDLLSESETNVLAQAGEGFRGSENAAVSREDPYPYEFLSGGRRHVGCAVCSAEPLPLGNTDAEMAGSRLAIGPLEPKTAQALGSERAATRGTSLSMMSRTCRTYIEHRWHAVLILIGATLGPRDPVSDS